MPIPSGIEKGNTTAETSSKCLPSLLKLYSSPIVNYSIYSLHNPNIPIEINGKLYISVKGTTKAYEKDEGTIRHHIRNNPEIFEDHVVDLKKITDKKKFSPYFSDKQLKAHGIWLDKFAFYKIGTLLNSSPITNPIKMICFLNKE